MIVTEDKKLLRKIENQRDLNQQPKTTEKHKTMSQQQIPEEIHSIQTVNANPC